ncbi:hypothetical protein M758_6G134700 [Ceratodon purpureus]|uniref:Uncharacterized protein n=1 Tax=Ceratodon purpureus TaxID=3225 RepID=A0A8T0HI36_CERPU|nr:hypothetical protein KC19_6G140000 [Ceratodon purpureus]KAG0613860.1 hypothetical protein M758_6G134700 [Ceratodon purpureus]
MTINSTTTILKKPDQVKNPATNFSQTSNSQNIQIPDSKLLKIHDTPQPFSANYARKSHYVTSPEPTLATSITHPCPSSNNTPTRITQPLQTRTSIAKRQLNNAEILSQQTQLNNTRTIPELDPN